jgi:hypothetical protein
LGKSAQRKLYKGVRKGVRNFTIYPELRRALSVSSNSYSRKVRRGDGGQSTFELPNTWVSAGCSSISHKDNPLVSFVYE